MESSFGFGTKFTFRIPTELKEEEKADGDDINIEIGNPKEEA